MPGSHTRPFSASARAVLLAALLLAMAPPCPGALTGAGMDNLRWEDFADVNRSCGGRHGRFKDAYSSGVCEPYMTGRWCADGFGLLGYIRCTTTKKDRRKCERISEGCRYPLKVLTSQRDSSVLPLLHASQPGPIDSCLRARQKARPLHFLFIGDSQTLMLEFEFRRWASGGGVFPRYEEVMGLGGGEVAWSSSNVFVTQLIDRCGASAFSSPENVTARVRAALSEIRPHSHIVVVAGIGIWDVVSSNCSKEVTLKYLEQDYLRLLDVVFGTLLDAAQPHDFSLDFYMRNQWFSYQMNGASFGDYLTLVNPVVERVFAAKRAQYEQPSTLRFRYLDVYSLSEARQKEMPYFGDGVHWACYSKMPYQQCHHGLLSATSRPDEVAWAAVQLILLDFCGIYSL